MIFKPLKGLRNKNSVEAHGTPKTGPCFLNSIPHAEMPGLLEKQVIPFWGGDSVCKRLVVLEDKEALKDEQDWSGDSRLSSLGLP